MVGHEFGRFYVVVLYVLETLINSLVTDFIQRLKLENQPTKKYTRTIQITNYF